MKHLLFAAILTPSLVFADNSTQPAPDSWGQFVSKQLTNPRELLTDSIIISVVDVALGDFTRSLGQNPNAKLILRDISKAPGLSANIASRNEVGGTGYFYDESHFFAHTTKIATKVATYFFLKNVCLFSPGAAAVLANLPGDTVGRFFIVAGQTRQDLNSSQPFHLFLADNFESKWISATILQQLPNLPSMHILGGLAGSYAISSKIQALTLAGMNAISPHTVVIGATFRENIAHTNSAITKVRIFLIMTTASIAEKAFFGFVFPPISRLMMALGTSVGTWVYNPNSEKSDEL